MFMENGKLSRVKELVDGRVAYWRGPDISAAVLTSSQLEEVQRLSARRLGLPYGFIMFGAGLVFLSVKGQVPLTVSVIFGAIAMLICILADVAAKRGIERILSQAPTEDGPPPHVSVPSRLKALWHGSEDGHLRLATWLTGAWAFSAAFGLVSKLTGFGGFDPRDDFHPLTLLIATVVPLLLFRLCLTERRRRSTLRPPPRT